MTTAFGRLFYETSLSKSTHFSVDSEIIFETLQTSEAITKVLAAILGI